jgi:hypothetical protein
MGARHLLNRPPPERKDTSTASSTATADTQTAQQSHHLEPTAAQPWQHDQAPTPGALPRNAHIQRVPSAAVPELAV